MVSCRQAFLLSGLLCGFMLAGLRTPFRQFHHALCHMKVVAPWRRRSLPWHAPHTRHPVFGCQGSDYVYWFGRKKTSGVMISQSVSGWFSLSLNARESCSPAGRPAFLHDRCRDLLQTISLRPKSLFYSWCFNEMAGLSYLLQLVWMILRLFSYPCRKPCFNSSMLSIQQPKSFVNSLFEIFYFLSILRFYYNHILLLFTF